MQLGEITYTKQEKQFFSFQDLYLICFNITFFECDQYTTLCLKQSKTNINHTGVLIILAAINSLCWPVKTLCRLFTYDLQSSSTPLFTYNNTSFTRRYAVEQLRLRLAITNISFAEYSGHCSRLVAAQHASDNGILDDDIQKLGC